MAVVTGTSSPVVARGPAADAGVFSVVGFLTDLLRRRWLVIGLTAGTVLLGTIIALFFPRWVSNSTFYPDTEGDTSRLAGIASQLGINVAGSTGESVQFYASLVTSREVLTSAATTVYHVPTGNGDRDTLSGTLIDLYEPRGDTPAEKLKTAVATLDERVTVTPDLDAGTVRVQVEARWPALAEQINRRLLDLVNVYNVERRQSQARSEREFVERRLKDAKRDLETAQARMQAFLDANRTYATSPRLQFEADRLRADIDTRQEVYTTLAQAYENARIDEVRNTPVFTIVDRPEGSAVRSVKLFGAVVLGAIVGGVMGVAWVFLGLFYGRWKEDNPAEILAFEQALRALLRDLSPRDWWRRLARGRGRG